VVGFIIRHSGFGLYLVVVGMIGAFVCSFTLSGELKSRRERVTFLMIPMAIAVIMLVVYLLSDHGASSTSATGTQPTAGQLPGRTQAPPASETPQAQTPTPHQPEQAGANGLWPSLESQLAEWDAKVPVSWGYQPQLSDSNEMWVQIANHWLHDLMTGSSYYGPELSLGVVEDSFGPLAALSTEKNALLDQPGQMVQGKPGDTDRYWRGWVYTNDGQRAQHYVHFWFVTDPQGRNHILLSIKESLPSG
jgi:hypothetical protein